MNKHPDPIYRKWFPQAFIGEEESPELIQAIEEIELEEC